MVQAQRSFIFYFFLSVLFLLVQVYAIDEMSPIHGIVNVYIYFLPLLIFFPIRTSSYLLASVALILGLCMDIIYDSFGLFMLAGFWVGSLRNNILKIFFSSRKMNLIGSEYIGLGNMPFLSLVLFFFLIQTLHSFILILMETFSLSFTYHFILKWLLDSMYGTLTLLTIYIVYHKIALRSTKK